MKGLRIAVLAAIAVAAVSYMVVAQRAPLDRGPNRPPQHPVVAALDVDGNGEVSAAEIAGAPKALATLDKNKDGKLTGDELGSRRRGGPRPGTSSDASMFTCPLKSNSDEEKAILAVLDAMNTERRGMMNVPVSDGRLLRLLAESVGAKHVVEIGTSNGYSGIWLSLALRTTGGKLTTYEIDKRRAELARKNFKRAGVDSIVTLVEGDAHKEVVKLTEPIDILFLDADKAGYVDYLKKLLPLVRPGGLIVAHNMNTRQADPNYIKAITTNPKLETIFLHMRAAGVGVTMKKR